MFFVVVPMRRRVGVRLKGTGTFFCLNCEKVRHFERREWQRSRHWSEFILCTTCELAFRPECLDESSVAYLEEVLIEGLPARALSTELRTVCNSTPTLEYETPTLEYELSFGSDDASVATPMVERAEELRAYPRSDSLIAYTSGRRH